MPLIQQFATELAADELAHLRLLRSTLGPKHVVARPAIDLQNSFTAAARAAGVVASTDTFDPFASDDNFLLGAFMLEDVEVTAYQGAAPFLHSSSLLIAAAGIQGTEAYHGSFLRTTLLLRGQTNPSLIDSANKIAAYRASISSGHDAGITSSSGTAQIVPTDANALTFARSFAEVINILYGGQTTPGGFFPSGLNGLIS